MKEFISGIVRGFNVRTDGTHVGAVMFSNTAKELFDFDKDSTLTSVCTKIKAMEYGGHVGKAGLGLVKAGELFENNYRQGVPNILLVFIAGQSADSVVKPAGILHESGVTVYPVGIGSRFNEYNLKNMATAPAYKHIFTADFGDLPRMKEIIRARLCADLRAESCPQGHFAVGFTRGTKDENRGALKALTCSPAPLCETNVKLCDDCVYTRSK